MAGKGFADGYGECTVWSWRAYVRCLATLEAWEETITHRRWQALLDMFGRSLERLIDRIERKRMYAQMFGHIHVDI